MLPPIINPSPGESPIPRASVIVFRGSPPIINPLVQGGDLWGEGGYYPEVGIIHSKI